MNLYQAVNYIKLNPKFLKSSFIIDKDKVLTAYNPEQIRRCLLKAYRCRFLFRNIKGDCLK